MVMVSEARSERIQHLHLREDVRTCHGKPPHKRALGGFYLGLFCAEDKVKVDPEAPLPSHTGGLGGVLK